MRMLTLLPAALLLLWTTALRAEAPLVLEAKIPQKSRTTEQRSPSA